MTVEVGFLRDYYVINLTFNGQALLLKRIKSIDDMPKTTNLWQYIFTHPKWLSTLVYTLIFMLLTGGIIYLIFLRKSYFQLTLFVYLVLFLFSTGLVWFGNLLGFSETGYFAARNFKEILSSPFIAMLLIPAFMLHQRSNQ
jgi:hypothetical protein